MPHIADDANDINSDEQQAVGAAARSARDLVEAEALPKVGMGRDDR